MKAIKAMTVAAVFSFNGIAAHAADVVVGVPSWPSAAATAYILKTVMEENLGLDVATQSGSNAVIFEAMDRDSMHVHPEVWLPNQNNLYKKYVEERGTVVQNDHGVEAKQGICITQATSEKYAIKSIYDLTDPDKSVLFDTNGNGLGELWIGEPGAASTVVEKIRAKSYGYDQTMDLVSTDTPINWAALDAADKAGKPYAFFCYTPHYVFSVYDLVFLQEPEHNADTWNVLQPTDNPDWLAKSNADSAWPVAHLYVDYAKSLQESHPEVAMLLKNVQFSADIVSDLSYSMVVEKKDPEALAHEWVKEHSSLVESWLGQ
ncbi:glycine betaine ABC transporter substrate-binding protein [Amphritea sp. 1_MG-2023]|uniref:ABC transporter substrate-binding protein n=1 Tax=Amphritea sp. 1_MG-2023 TaxID=3062670 RepID=UPI0026E38AA6|nr:glycine betaine ABC transporter substrate-binding protein [Amphritea sp. 1_MG-2023]MDO6565255.1 glycine betaine ABC transporter substrate-binding protein [Amphritea sp. 1_MG-2023]